MTSSSSSSASSRPSRRAEAARGPNLPLVSAFLWLCGYVCPLLSAGRYPPRPGGGRKAEPVKGLSTDGPRLSTPRGKVRQRLSMVNSPPSQGWQALTGVLQPKNGSGKPPTGPPKCSDHAASQRRQGLAPLAGLHGMLARIESGFRGAKGGYPEGKGSRERVQSNRQPFQQGESEDLGE